MNDYIVYKHTSPNGKFYIGITSQGTERRWRADGSEYKPKEGRTTHFYNAILKYGWDNFEHEILYDNLTKEEAEEIERELIDKYDLTNPEYGYNTREGGGSQGHLSDETKNKMKAMLALTVIALYFSFSLQVQLSTACHPKCSWKCDDPHCPAICDPVCEPPKCHTSCAEPKNAICDVKCEKPECEIKCPDKGCEGIDCPKCVTVCKQPHCVTHCQAPKPECEAVCEEPKCDWKCRKPECPKPKCELVCESPNCKP